MLERYLIVAGLILCYALAGWYVAQGKPAYVPKPVPVMKCERNGCQVLGMLV